MCYFKCGDNMKKKLIKKCINRISYYVNEVDTWLGFYQPKKPTPFSNKNYKKNPNV